jgi:hypothetical protein
VTDSSDDTGFGKSADILLLLAPSGVALVWALASWGADDTAALGQWTWRESFLLLAAPLYVALAIWRIRLGRFRTGASPECWRSDGLHRLDAVPGSLHAGR